MSELLSLEEAVLQVLRWDEVLSHFDAIVNIADLRDENNINILIG